LASTSTYSRGAGTKPPSPRTSSRTTQAIRSGATWVRKNSSNHRAASAAPVQCPRYSYGYGSRYTSGANGPNPYL